MWHISTKHFNLDHKQNTLIFSSSLNPLKLSLGLKHVFYFKHTNFSFNISQTKLKILLCKLNI
jgi:hypothetical protein